MHTLNTCTLCTYRCILLFLSDTWSNVPNPCINNPQKKIYHLHPADPTKFIQCDLLGRMYIIQCPKGDIYNAQTGSCTAGKVTTSVPNPRVTPPATTTTKATTVTTTTTRATTTAAAIQNPCSNINLAKGMVYFAHPKDHTKFIQCDLLGTQRIEQCKHGLVWNQGRLACVYAIYPGGFKTTTKAPVTTTHTVRVTTTAIPRNPCTPNAKTTDQLFHPHPDPHKFYQCDLWGDVFENTCPPNLIWRDNLKTCSSSYLQLPSHVVG